jgi:hypothetical protein
MPIWLRAIVLSLSGILVAIGVSGGLDAHHFPAAFMEVGILVVMFLGIPIVVLTIVLMAIEHFLGKYGRRVVTSICAAPGLCLYVLALEGDGDWGYVFTAVGCFIGWAALWFITAPRASA